VVHSQCGNPRLATTAQKQKMMMRRVQTAAAVSGGGEGVSDVPDESDASSVIFVSCNASAMLTRRHVMFCRISCCRLHEAKLSCWLQGSTSCLRHLQRLASKIYLSRQQIYPSIRQYLHVYSTTRKRANASSSRFLLPSRRVHITKTQHHITSLGQPVERCNVNR